MNTDEHNPILNRSEWEIPDFETKLWRGRSNSWCVVIPVINEGERIRKLLDSMRKLHISSIADIIIVDGGSDDGSLDDDILSEYSVSGHLLKNGSGKLSSQLRCAYAFSLDHGYNGVITIDGNNKDDPEAIPRFIDALESGYDFVQGSRFVDGGIAENTPSSRNFAIRYIHAPLLSCFSGFKWTDTTQGYRAYSRRMLINPNIALFRNIFSTYELLAYLSYRAPILGYRCIELATIRRYPKGEVPTKISAIKGNWLVFKILISACFGLYNK